MNWVIYLIERGSDNAPVGEWLKDANVEAFNGRGECLGTLDVSEAKKFSTVQEAMRFYNKVPACRPIREDGRPNKPLTAYTVEIQSV